MGSRRTIDRTARSVWSWLLTGVALTIPLVITILVLGVVTNFLLNLVSPVVTVVRIIPGINPIVEGFLVQTVSLLSLVGFLIAVGAVADLTEDSYAPRFHARIESIPLVGDVYGSFRRMGDVFVESDIGTFQDVKLVEFPHTGAYSLAFVTADTPERIQTAAGEIEMQTLFVPLAPNPAMGGFLVNFAAEQIYDVDVTVEEAVQSIVTSGVSIEVTDRDRDRPLSMDELGDMAMDPINEDFDGVDVGEDRTDSDGGGVTAPDGVVDPHSDPPLVAVCVEKSGIRDGSVPPVRDRVAFRVAVVAAPVRGRLPRFARLTGSSAARYRSPLRCEAGSLASLSRRPRPSRWAHRPDYPTRSRSRRS